MLTLHIVPHTHWDREWYLPFQVFRIKLVHLIDSLLTILDQDPEFRFFTLDGQTILLEDYLQIRPHQRNRILKHIQDGRLFIGPWYVLPDEFLVSPEALVRNLLLGRYISSQFGKGMQVGYLPDPFGHIGQMPQVLRGFGIESAAFKRGLGSEPCELLWEARDGSRVLAIYLRDGYDNAARLPANPDVFKTYLQERTDSLLPHSAVSHLLLLNGADHHEPQPELPALIASTELERTTVRISNLPLYLEAVGQEIEAGEIALPLVSGELRNSMREHLLPGVLSSRVWIKQRNHHCETMLERWAEPFSAWADLYAGKEKPRTLWTGHLTTPRISQPHAVLQEAWRMLLTCHPHDSICGCSIDQVHEEMRSRFDQVEQIADEITRQSLATLANHIDTSHLSGVNARSAIVVFNPNAEERNDISAARIELPAGLDPFEIVDAAGRCIPFRLAHRRARSLADMEFDREGLAGMLAMVQHGTIMGLAVQEVAIFPQPDHVLIDIILAEEAKPSLSAVKAGMQEVQKILAEDSLSKFRVLAHFATEVDVEFLAPHVPGYGYQTFGLRPAPAYPDEEILDDTHQIANEMLQVDVAPNGTLTLFDKRINRAFADLLRFEDQADRGDSYTFCPLEEDAPILSTGPIRGLKRRQYALGEELEYELSLLLPEGLSPDRATRSEVHTELPIKIIVRLRPALPMAEIELWLKNTVKDHRLRCLFPFARAVQSAEYDGHFEIISRSTKPMIGDEHWVEQPVQEQPMRNFLAVRSQDHGLMLATRGLREASVSPEGELAITLLRCFGWLSRDDLATRKGGAGPQLPTPAGQSLGQHAFHLALIPFQQDWHAAVELSQVFQSNMRGQSTTIKSGLLPAQASFLQVHPSAFALTAVYPSRTGTHIILRGVNHSEKALEVDIHSLIPLREAHLTRLDETPIEKIAIREEHFISLTARSGEILTVLLKPRSAES